MMIVEMFMYKSLIISKVIIIFESSKKYTKQKVIKSLLFDCYVA